MVFKNLCVLNVDSEDSDVEVGDNDYNYGDTVDDGNTGAGGDDGNYGNINDYDKYSGND